MRWKVFVALACVALGGGWMARAEEEGSRHASIDFVSLGGIDDWRAQGDDAMLIKGLNGSWYRAEFSMPCSGIKFRERVAFVTDGSDRLDKFSSVLVDGQRCWFRSFEKVDPAAAIDEGHSTREKE